MEVCRELFLSIRTACIRNPVVLLRSSVEEGKENRSQERLEAGSSFLIIRAVIARPYTVDFGSIKGSPAFWFFPCFRVKVPGSLSTLNNFGLA